MSGRVAQLCPEHRRVLERADTGEGLMCPAGDGPGVWHLVDEPLSIDRHSGKEIEPARSTEGGDVAKPKEEKSNACPKCGKPKRGVNARDGEPCKACRGAKARRSASAPKPEGEAPRRPSSRVARRPASPKRAASGLSRFLVISEGPDLEHAEVLVATQDPELLRQVGELFAQRLGRV